MKILRLKNVIETTGLSRSSIYRMLAEEEVNDTENIAESFPRPIPLGGRSIGWVSHEVDDWVQSRIDLRDANLKSGKNVYG